MPEIKKPFEDCFNRIIDTSLKCPRCNGPIFHARGKALPDVGFNQIYSCSCVAFDVKRFSKYYPLTIERWEFLAKDRNSRGAPDTLYGIALPPPDFRPLERARRVMEAYNPEEHGKRLKSRVARWEAACADAKDAIEELIGIQEELSDWQANLPENFSGSALADKLDEICDLSFDDALSAIEEAETVDLPLGFGRD